MITLERGCRACDAFLRLNLWCMDSWIAFVVQGTYFGLDNQAFHYVSSGRLYSL
jgi:hypothetical protein